MGSYTMLVGKIKFKPGAAALVENLIDQRENSKEFYLDWFAAIAVCPMAQTSESIKRFAEDKEASGRYFNFGSGHPRSDAEWPADGPYVRWDMVTGELDLAITLKYGAGLNDFLAILPELADEWHFCSRGEGWEYNLEWHDFPEVDRPKPEPEEHHGYGF